MNRVTFPTWAKFQIFIDEYCRRPVARRRQLLFRGQSSSRWALTTTLDREQRFADDSEREEFLTKLLRRFRRESMQLNQEDLWRLTGEALEFKARHHGLPTPILDWTESPYIASYFAFAHAVPSKADQVSIWVLDRALLTGNVDEIAIIDDEELLARNQRAVRQRGIVMRVRSISRTVEEVLDHALSKFELPASEAPIALAHLDEMTITDTTLLGDLDAVARTVRYREFPAEG